MPVLMSRRFTPGSSYLPLPDPAGGETWDLAPQSFAQSWIAPSFGVLPPGPPKS
jgi:hypothetical protein